MNKFVTVCCAIALCGAAYAQNTPRQGTLDSVGETLIAKSKAVPEALHAKDAKVLNQLLAPDFKIVGSEGRLHDRGEVVGAAEEGIVRDFMFYNPEVVKINDDSALVTYNLIVTMPEGDDLLAPRYQKISDLWVKTG